MTCVILFMAAIIAQSDVDRLSETAAIERLEEGLDWLLADRSREQRLLAELKQLSAREKKQPGKKRDIVAEKKQLNRRLSTLREQRRRIASAREAGELPAEPIVAPLRLHTAEIGQIGIVEQDAEQWLRVVEIRKSEISVERVINAQFFGAKDITEEEAKGEIMRIVIRGVDAKRETVGERLVAEGPYRVIERGTEGRGPALEAFDCAGAWAALRANYAERVK